MNQQNGGHLTLEKYDADYARGIRRRFSRIGVALVAMLLVSLALQLLLINLISTLAPELTQTDWYSWALSLLTVHVAGGLTFFLLIKGQRPAERPEKHKLKLSHWLVLLVMCFGLMYAGNILGNYLMMLISGIKGEPIDNVLLTALDTNIIINLVAVVLIGPVIEELIFRRLILDRIGMFGEKTAIVFSALLFALFHNNIYQFFYAFALGVMFAYIYMRTGRLRYCVSLHMVINLFGGVIAPWLVSQVDMDSLNEFVQKANDSEFYNTIANDPAAMSEFMSSYAADLPAFFMYAAYSTLFMAVSVVGVVLLLGMRRRFITKQASFELPRERVGNTVYFNYGVIAAILSYTILTLLVLIL